MSPKGVTSQTQCAHLCYQHLQKSASCLDATTGMEHAHCLRVGTRKNRTAPSCARWKQRKARRPRNAPMLDFALHADCSPSNPFCTILFIALVDYINMHDRSCIARLLIFKRWSLILHTIRYFDQLPLHSAIMSTIRTLYFKFFCKCIILLLGCTGFRFPRCDLQALLLAVLAWGRRMLEKVWNFGNNYNWKLKF